MGLSMIKSSDVTGNETKNDGFFQKKLEEQTLNQQQQNTLNKKYAASHFRTCEIIP